MRMAGSPSSSAAGPANRGENARRPPPPGGPPQPPRGKEPPRHIITVLSPQQAVEPFGESADHRRRKHMRQLDEGITTEGFTLGSIKSVGGCEFDRSCSSS